MYQSDLIAHNNKFIRFMIKSKKQQTGVFSTVIVYSTLSIFFLIVSIFYFISQHKIIQYQITDYQNKNQCLNKTTCNVTIIIQNQMNAPIYLLYEIQNMYQNNRKYMLSKDNYQLAGNIISSEQANRYCFPIVYNKNLDVNMSWANMSLVPDAVANPCGLLAKSYFNDSYSLYQQTNIINITQNGIAWPREKGKKMKQSINTTSIQWINPQSERFEVWMRNSGLSTFKKPWGIINQNLYPGKYNITIQNLYDMNQYNGKKSIIITTVGTFGAKNRFIPLSLLFFSILLLCCCGVFVYKYVITSGTFGPIKVINLNQI